MTTPGPETDSPRSRVRACIEGSGLPQREFAKRIGLDETKLSKALKGTRRFSPEELIRVAQVAGVTVNWLLSGADDTSGPAATPTAKSLPTRHREGQEQAKKRREIIEASWWLIAEKGYNSVRIADIAAACGTSSASIHYYFATKREIFEETLRYSVKLAFDRQVASLHTIAHPLARLKHLVALQFPTGNTGRAEWSIWLQTWSEVATGGASKENHTQGYRRWYQTVFDLIVVGQQEGVFVDVPADYLATELTSLVDGFGIKVLTGMASTATMRHHIERFIDRSIAVDSQSSESQAAIPEEAPHEP
ncbi:TetR family transcriptional regulator C-terminal domain-containing protein [Saxibacter everestensis]|uniref:TetR family transcriptional regulator C-terminal domain-containing protein n=1 Tax=Saxibacter everestensis TaxID=2909229 RepID=A0ABY8QTW6_9MICO|nr:TetR family transcriptional regulator C-terminal domain-containing protein [Brevibacteriaceae bacterium ZFBP1038]